MLITSYGYSALRIIVKGFQSRSGNAAGLFRRKSPGSGAATQDQRLSRYFLTRFRPETSAHPWDHRTVPAHKHRHGVYFSALSPWMMLTWLTRRSRWHAMRSAISLVRVFIHPRLEPAHCLLVEFSWPSHGFPGRKQNAMSLMALPNLVHPSDTDSQLPGRFGLGEAGAKLGDDALTKFKGISHGDLQLGNAIN